VQSSAPAISRRHAAGAESARDLLFTVLGEFVLAGGGSAWTSAFIGVLSRLGVEEKASRQALMRTAADGWLASERVGRRTRWQLTADAERLLTEGRERIYGFTGSVPEWDGGWLLVLARVPDTDRPARHALRTRLSRAGFGSPGPGVWISTHTERVDEVERVLREAGVLDGAQIFVAEYHGGGDLASMVSRAWNLDAIEESYRDFIDEFAVAGSDDPLARLVGLVHGWRRFPWIDPALPSDLLPAMWSGEQAASLFAKLHIRWADDATAEWMRLNGRGAR
jgi:phenylacetic acid degradation operon negative regulatory protein